MTFVPVSELRRQAGTYRSSSFVPASTIRRSRVAEPNLLESFFSGVGENLIPFVDLTQGKGAKPTTVGGKVAKGVGSALGLLPSFLIPGGIIAKVPKVAQLLGATSKLQKLLGLATVAGTGGAFVGGTRPGTPLEERPMEAIKGFAETAPLGPLGMLPGGLATKMAVGAGYFGGQTALTGGSPEDIISSTIIGGGFPLAEKGLGKVKPKAKSVADIKKEVGATPPPDVGVAMREYLALPAPKEVPTEPITVPPGGFKASEGWVTPSVEPKTGVVGNEVRFVGDIPKEWVNQGLKAGEGVKPPAEATKVSTEQAYALAEQTNLKAEFNAQVRGALPESTLKDIDALQKSGYLKKYASGDVETLRKTSRRDVVNRIIESVKETFPEITSDDEAFQFVVDLPTKAEATAKVTWKNFAESLNPPDTPTSPTLSYAVPFKQRSSVVDNALGTKMSEEAYAKFVEKQNAKVQGISPDKVQKEFATEKPLVQGPAIAKPAGATPTETVLPKNYNETRARQMREFLKYGYVSDVYRPRLGEISRIRDSQELSWDQKVAAAEDIARTLPEEKVAPWATGDPARVGIKEQAQLKIEQMKASRDEYNKLNSENAESDAILKAFITKPASKNILSRALDNLSKLNVYRFENGVVGQTALGKKLVTLVKRAAHTATITAQEMRTFNEKAGLKVLSPQELTNMLDVILGKATPITPDVAKAATTFKEMFSSYWKRYGPALGQEKFIENYFPRYLNEAGKAHYGIPANREQIINNLMVERGIDRARALDILDNGLRKGSFEFLRSAEEVPQEYLLKPDEALLKWEVDTSRRIGTFEQLGADESIARKLIAEIGKGDKYEKQLKKEATDLLDRYAGRIDNRSVRDPIYDVLKMMMVTSKIDPLTSIPNALQSHINAYLDYGLPGLWDTMTGRGGKELAKGLGFESLRDPISGDIKTSGKAAQFTDWWMGKVGMKATENYGYRRSAVASFKAINRAFDALLKNPADAMAKKLLNDHAMFPEDAKLAEALRDGKIPEMEMKLGIVEGVRRKMFFNTVGERPAWAAGGAGSVAYIFHSYILNQMRLLASAPTSRQLMYLMVIAPILGYPVMTLRRFLTGREQPEDISAIFEAASQAGPGTPFDLYKTISTPAFLQNFVSGGFSPIAEGFEAATSKDPTKAAAKVMVSNLPLGRDLKYWMFPPKQ